MPTFQTLKRLVLLLCVSLSVTSCGDSHDKLMRDQIAYMDEMSTILEKVADGSMSSADATRKLEKWNEKGAAIKVRKTTLNAKATPEQLEALGKKYQEEAMKSAGRMMASMQKLQTSGRLTPELARAASNLGD